jgi:hypothetical protein
MDRKAVAAARTEFGRAKQSLADLAASNDFAAVERHWAAFLVSAGRVFTKLEQGSKTNNKSKGWWSRIVGTRRSDPLLCYIWHARHADEHGIESVTQQHPGYASVVEPTPEEKRAFEEAMRAETRPYVPLGMVEWLPPHLRLVDVVNYDQRYSVPLSHLGTAITNPSPHNVGSLAMTYLEQIVSEADALST